MSEHNFSNNQCDLKYPYCLVNDTPVWIDYIYTVHNGKQINIPERIDEIRKHAQNNELLCPCGCGTPMTLYAPDKSSSRRQHFKKKKGCSEKAGHVWETKQSIWSKVVLKGWLEDKLCPDNLQFQYSANKIGNTDRKYEYSFVSPDHHVSVIYSRDRINLSDEKIDVLSSCNDNLRNVYIVDISNQGNDGQFPERLYPIQEKQGYCLMLDIDNYIYSQEHFYDGVRMSAMFYAKDNDGLWKENVFIYRASLGDFSFSDNGDLLYQGKSVSEWWCSNAKEVFDSQLKEDLQHRKEAEDHARQLRETTKILPSKNDSLRQTKQASNEQQQEQKKLTLQQVNEKRREEEKQHNTERISNNANVQQTSSTEQPVISRGAIEDSKYSNSGLIRENNGRWEQGLNPSQYEAANQINGQVLILAGAGSGKTKTLTHRICHMIESGINPKHILAITFTNKAAKEMNERVESLIGHASHNSKPKMCTFHSLGFEIIREFGSILGYGPHIGICDDDDTKKRMKKIIKEIETEEGQPEGFLTKNEGILGEAIAFVSTCKDWMISPEKSTELDCSQFNSSSDLLKNYGSLVYEKYQADLKKDNQVDFDDLIYQTVLLLQNPSVADILQNRYQYVSVDEYQDTNHAQFEMVRLLTAVHQNICVVGDDYQGIYGFRGADIDNILFFKESYPNAKVFYLRENYRSTGNIVDGASRVIAHNKKQMHKDLYSMSDEGKPITVAEFDDFKEEAKYIASKIKRDLVKGRTPDDYAVLYRNNHHSRFVEDALLAENIPYIIYGGVSFYARKEIKDIVAYLRLVAGFEDTVALERVVNIPKRGMGKKATEDLLEYIRTNDGTLLEKLSDFSLQGKKNLSEFSETLSSFYNEITATGNDIKKIQLSNLVRDLVSATKYEDYLETECTKASSKENEFHDRLENVYELVSKAKEFDSDYRNDYPDAPVSEVLEAFLESVSLFTDMDRNKSDIPAVKLMTMHTSKGLEFRTVFLAACEDDLKLSSFVEKALQDMLEEERRLFYVAMTRAKRKLYITSSARRFVWGRWEDREPLRFISEIPDENVSKCNKKRSSWSEDDADFLSSRIAAKHFWAL